LKPRTVRVAPALGIPGERLLVRRKLVA